MPERCVYVSLSVLGMASAYPDAGISWVLVCVCVHARPCHPTASTHTPHNHFTLMSLSDWNVMASPPPASPTHSVNITFRFILLSGRDTDPRQSTDLLPFYHTHSELHKTNKNNYCAFKQKVSKHETDAWMLFMDSIGWYLQS